MIKLTKELKTKILYELQKQFDVILSIEELDICDIIVDTLYISVIYKAIIGNKQAVIEFKLEIV